jgi:hypothetical protein
LRVVLGVEGLLPPGGPLALAPAEPAPAATPQKAGRTIPLKLALTCAGAPVSGAVLAAAGLGAPEVAGLFRDGAAIALPASCVFGFVDGCWSYDWKTPGVAGTYRVEIRTPDGQIWQAAFELR